MLDVGFDVMVVFEGFGKLLNVDLAAADKRKPGIDEKQHGERRFLGHD